ncbi:hypothetical protein BAE44_0002970 [Dichanthelium oligosanthes]|uniref:Uncharacterized protein n=1 Tax=Dichanthelium oligosanthes TaxID=888268 RepID=A0A1E5WF99_9POAL|nr:hypothetical protein BAE44_0002970 [Dichanthelium oligosanthes]
MAPVNLPIHPPRLTQTRRANRRFSPRSCKLATTEETDATGHHPPSRWCEVTPATATRVRATATGLLRRPVAPFFLKLRAGACYVI